MDSLEIACNASLESAQKSGGIICFHRHLKQGFALEQEIDQSILGIVKNTKAQLVNNLSELS